MALASESRIINGVPVPEGLFPEVVTIRTDGSVCTATIVGPRILLTSAHCGKTGAMSAFQAGGNGYKGMFVRPGNYPEKDSDIAVVVTSAEMKGVTPISVGGTVSLGQTVFLLGYGCTMPGGGGGNDGVLRVGESVITQIDGEYFTSRKPDGAALCFGDSGGPTYAKEDSHYRVVGVGSKGNIKDTNYSYLLASVEARDFLQEVANFEKLDICGVNTVCEGTLPVEPRPKFKENTYEFRVASGMTFSTDMQLNLQYPVKDVSWTLDPAAPHWLRMVKGVLVATPPPGSAGQYLFNLTAKNSNGSDSIWIKFSVVELEEKIGCTLTASPTFIRLGESLTLNLETTGPVNLGFIENKLVPVPSGNRVITPTTSGIFIAKAIIQNETAVGNCQVRYGVK